MEIKSMLKNPFKKKESYITRMLIMRFSAMGDVAMTIPVIHSLASQHRELRITVVTRNRFAPMFQWLPANVEVKGYDIDAYEGVTGLTRLYNELKQYGFDVVADLHDVIRTKYLRTCFRLGGAKVAVVDKGRKEKHRLIGNGQKADALKPMFERYADVFRQLGYPVKLDYKEAFNPLNENFKEVRAVVGKKGGEEKWIGIAPFAAHAQKVYPLDKMRSVAYMLSDKGYRVFLFGAGKAEKEELESWECSGVKSVAGEMGGLYNEILLMSQLDAMVSMDSANMHIASLVGVPVVSVWGATHPKAGFCGFGQSESSILQLDLPCRPCSIYGNAECKLGDLRCLNGIRPEDIVNKVVSTINNL